MADARTVGNKRDVSARFVFEKSASPAEASVKSDDDNDEYFDSPPPYNQLVVEHEEPIREPEADADAGTGSHPEDASEMKKPKHARFHRLFPSVPLTELLVSRFSCASQIDRGRSLQGHLYVSRNWICFYANIFGIKRTLEIPFGSVVRVSKEKTAKVFPNAIAIHTDSRQRYLFGSLLSRDNTYHLLITLLERSSMARGVHERRAPAALSDAGAKHAPAACQHDEADASSSDLTDDERSAAEPFPPAAALPTKQRPLAPTTPLLSWQSRANMGLVLVSVICIVLICFLSVFAALMSIRLFYGQRHWTLPLKMAPCMALPEESYKIVDQSIERILGLLHEVRSAMEALQNELVKPARS